MAESIFARISRLLSATVEDKVDRMEQAGGEAVMREAIREADRAIDAVKAQHEAVMGRRLQAVRQKGLLDTRIAELNAKAHFALDQARDDLAEAALSRQVDFEAQGQKLHGIEADARAEEARLLEGLAALQARKSQMEEALSAFVQAKRDAAVGGDGPTRPQRTAERAVDIAEAAFNRAMAGVGGVGFTHADAQTINRVAELDGLQRSAAIADRMATLKAQRAA